MLELKNIFKDYSSGENIVKALQDINISFDTAGFVSILGPSGCGKTTLLNIIGGLDHYTSGDLLIDGRTTKDFKDKDWDAYRNKKIGFVFQSFNLINHLTNLENVSLASVLSGLSQTKSKLAAMESIKSIGLEDQAKKFPNQLSGGQAQRIAVARALVNNPEIILADEPTGALDTKSSVALMDLLKSISLNHLVLMVTHNKQLAETYSDRIITMKDGRIITDTSKPEGKKDLLYTGEIKKTKMSLLSSIKLAIRNITTKKTKNAVTAIASSFGIIGVGLVLALSNGFSTYVNKVQTQTTSNMPLLVSSTQTTRMKNPNYIDYQKFPDEDYINVYDSSKNGEYISLNQTNNLTSDYVNYLENIDNTKYAGSMSSKIVNYTNINHNIYSKNYDETTEEITYSKVNPYSNVSNSVSSIIASLTGLPRSILHEFYGDKNYILSSYDVLYGDYPENDMVGDNTFETALVLDSYNRVEIGTLQRLGFFTNDEIDKIVNNGGEISFSDFVGKEYSFYLNDDIYPEQQGISFISEDRDSNQQTITVRQTDGSYETYNIQIPRATINQYRAPSDADYGDLYNGNYATYDESGNLIGTAKSYKLKVSAILRVKKDAIIDYMPASLCYTKGFKDFVYSENEFSNISAKAAQNVDVYNLQSFFNLYNTKNCYNPLISAGYLDVDTVIPNWAKELPDATVEDFTTAFSNSTHWYSIFSNFDSTTKLMSKDESALSYSYYLSNATASGTVFKEQTDINRLFSYFTDGDITNAFMMIQLDSTLLPRAFSYLAAKLSNYSQITSIVIFPSSLSRKADLKEYLDAYNIGKDSSNQVIYSDYVGEFTDSLYSIVSIISIVLVIFSSISLIVSGIMSSVIIYSSVLERTKEIGILRSIGAKKRDVGRLFKIESIITGVFSGILGIIFVYILSIPINIIVNNMYSEYNIGQIASLNVIAAIALIIVSGVLAYFSALIPARIAAKKDPVEALRTE